MADGANSHRIIRICERQGVPILTDRAYTCAGPGVTTGLKRPPGGELITVITKAVLTPGRQR
ncbi:hypothetical protein ABZ370_43465 [Streptomyces sp. NPDC005962]|uniref:hypothetical protein n=1 Tax=Streptomyces sp. NPDC005962 TaxID=3154466 RepID=UPI00340E5A7C